MIPQYQFNLNADPLLMPNNGQPVDYATAIDNHTLYYEWLDGDEAKVHEKIILSAITFWFKDEDAKEGKVWDYFND